MIAISMVSFPQESVDASVKGLNMWWMIVFPSLLPFFIVTELLIGFGVVKFIGVLLEPFMRPLFKVPGVGGFVWAMGMASGYPAGAKLTARLRQEKQLTKIEAERLASFTNSSNPLFIFGAVSVGFFNNPQLGILLALSHYLGNLSVGFMMRFYGRDLKSKRRKESRRISIKRAFIALHRTRINDKRPIGKLLGDAVMSSIQTLLMIGGFIILFSVINRLLTLLHITAILSLGVEYIFQLFRLPEELSIPFISGLFEITLGSKLTSGVEEASLMHQAIVTSFILAFSGFSVQAQVASILAQTDIRFKPFFIARICHGFFASIFAFLLWEPVYTRNNQIEQQSNALPAFMINESSWMYDCLIIIKDTGPLLTIIALIIYILIYFKRMKKVEN